MTHNQPRLSQIAQAIGLALLYLLPGVLRAQTDRADSPPATHWIWCERERVTDVDAVFSKDFTVENRVTSAILRCVGESASLSIELNDGFIAELEPYAQLLTRDVTDQVRAGTNHVIVRSASCAGPSAIFVRLDLTFDDGSKRAIATDTNWSCKREGQAAAAQPVSFGAVRDRLLIPAERRVGISAVDNYEQWKQALGAKDGSDPASFLVSPGFEIELVRSAKPDEDSWVSVAFDPQGRVVIAKEKQGLLRMKLSADGADVIAAETINGELQECRGLLFAFGDLFVNANNSKGMYRLHSNGSDGFDKAELLYASSGGVGHGRNDIALGPDGMVYMIHGDSVDLPRDTPDFTSPFRAARRGEKSKEGHLLRVDPSGGPVQLVAAGLRNPFGIDFNTEGDVFTYDADAEFDMGSPWYRPTRVSHLVTGGDFGWRGVTGAWPPYYHDHPDNALPNLDIGKGSPTAVKFGTRSNFPDKYREALYILDWAYGRILAVHLTPRGSSYLMTAETFIKGRPLNVTDLDFASDGSMYFVTGGRGTRSGLYRIRFVGDRVLKKQDETAQRKARQEFAAASRRERRELEQLLQADLPETDLESVWQHLADTDPWIRHAARNVVERVIANKPQSAWSQRAFAETNVTAAMTALMAVTRSDNNALLPQIVRRLNELDWQHSSEADVLTALYCYKKCLLDGHGVPERLVAAARDKLAGLYPARSYPANQLLSELLIPMGSPDAVAKTLGLMTSTTNQAEQMHYLFVLRKVRGRWTPEQRRTYFEVLAGTRHYLGGQGMPDFLKKIREEAIASLGDGEREALAGLIDPPAEASPEEAVAARPFVRKWTVQELADSLGEVDNHRDLARGKSLFSAAVCAKCHRFAGQGTPIGPDLTSASSRFSRRDLLDAILTPSKVIAEKYRSIQVITTAGKSYVGQAALGGDYRSPILRLATDPLHPFKITEINKLDIELQRPSPTSWMPAGLVDTLTRDEILDLLAYIESRGAAK